MKRIAAGFVWFVLPCVPLPAQVAPATPAGETASAFTANEAYAFACCQQIAATWRQGGVCELREWLRLPGYRGVQAIASPATKGELRFVAQQAMAGWHVQLTSAAIAGGDVLCYVVPEQLGDATRRVFCVRGDGVVAFSDNTAGTAIRGDRMPEPMDVLGDGAGDTLAAFPRTPGRGRDGNMWMPGDLVKQAIARVTLVGEDGAPLGMTTIAAVPADSPEETLDTAFPAGVGRTLREGDATWTGVPVKGLALEVRTQGSKLRVAKSAVTATGSSLRAVVSRTEFQRLAVSRNESAAIATLKNISSAQCQCQASGAIDVNGNGSGEYGTFAELTGRDVVRGGKQKLSPPVLSTAFGKVENGLVVRSGYCFRVFLPGKDGAALAELGGGGPDAAVDTGRAETMWCLYAWPVEPGVSGQRAFFIDQGGDVLAAPNDGRYGGKAKPPAPDAARVAGSDGRMSAAAAANTQGVDGQQWRVVN